MSEYCKYMKLIYLTIHGWISGLVLEYEFVMLRFYANRIRTSPHPFALVRI
jgi:hypothetical protein